MYTLEDKKYMLQLEQSEPQIHAFINNLISDRNSDLRSGCHDILNIISLISGNAQLLEMQIPELSANPRWKQLNKDLDNLISSMESISQYRYSHIICPQKTDIEEYLWSLQEELVTDLSIKSMQIAVTIPPSIPAVMADTAKISFVIKSLIQNILDENEKNTMVISADYDSTSVNIHIADTIDDFDEDVKNKLFNPFNTSKQNHIGLSLATSYKIILAHDGLLSYKPNVPRGSIFTISLPIIH